MAYDIPAGNPKSLKLDSKHIQSDVEFGTEVCGRVLKDDQVTPKNLYVGDI